MKPSFVIPTYTSNTKIFNMLFRNCIDSFIKFHGSDHEIIVVEDGGSMKEQVKNECQRLGLIYLENPVNSGFPITCNRGITAANGDVVILVNNDVVFTQPVIEPFEKAFNVHGRVGIVGSLLFYPHGQIQHGGIVMVGGGFQHRGYKKELSNASEVHHPSYLIAVTGALFGMRKEMLDEIGVFKKEYFLACDDTEICLRAWSRDWRTYYSPDIRAIHAEGATRGKDHSEKTKFHREWFRKELDTWKLFQNDLGSFNVGLLHEKVAQANSKIEKPIYEDGAEKMVFEGSVVTEKSVHLKSENILIRRTGALGDVILATGVIRQIKKDNPSSKIIVQTVCGDIFKNNPNVHQVIRPGETVNYDRYYDLDMVYEMHPKLPIWEAYSRAVYGESAFDPSPELFSTDADYENLKTKLGSINLDTDKVVVLHMAVSWLNRTWPRHHWVEVARTLSGLGYKVIVIGKGGDYRVDRFNNTLNLVDYLSIHEIRELLKRSVAFAGMDSGMLHVAQTTDVPIVGLFTVANPKYRIVPRASRTIALIPKVECRFCLHEKAVPVTFVDCKWGINDNRCLNGIVPDMVIKEIQECARKK